MYSLGVILFELLTGELPFRGNCANARAPGDPPTKPPSPRRFNGSVASDMETIVLKCLEKEPGKRYATAKDLSEDLTRFIDDRPILAKPITSLTRSLRWCRRNPVISGLSAGLLAVFLVGLIGVMTQWIRAEQKRIAAAGFSMSLT